MSSSIQTNEMRGSRVLLVEKSKLTMTPSRKKSNSDLTEKSIGALTSSAPTNSEMRGSSVTMPEKATPRVTPSRKKAKGRLTEKSMGMVTSSAPIDPARKRAVAGETMVAVFEKDQARLVSPTPMKEPVMILAEKSMTGLAPSSTGQVPVETIQLLMGLQKTRKFCITSQSRCDRSCEAYIVSSMNKERGDQDEEGVKALFVKARSVRKAVESGGEVQMSVGDPQLSYDLSTIEMVIMANSKSRESWDKLRINTEKEMRRLAHTLPVWRWVEKVAGFGDLGLAIIVGESGDLSGYATKSRLWKRLGLAVFDGERQRKHSNADMAMLVGYNPRRRAEIWAITDSMFKHQWAGEKEGVAAHAKGPFGEVYGRRKEHTLETHPDWTKAHRDNDARRIMSKALVKRLWQEWKQ